MDAFVKKALGLHVPVRPTVSPLLSNPETPSDESDATPVQETQNVQLENLVSLRNRVRRRLREIAGMIIPVEARPDLDYVLVGRQAALARDFAAMRRELQEALKRLKALAVATP